MVKIIETNILTRRGEITDHESRVIEVESWEQYVEEIKNGVSVDRNDIIGTLDGASLRRYCKIGIENLVVENHRLQCDVLAKGRVSKKLAYLVNEI